MHGNRSLRCALSLVDGIPRHAPGRVNGYQPAIPNQFLSSPESLSNVSHGPDVMTDRHRTMSAEVPSRPVW